MLEITLRSLKWGGWFHVGNGVGHINKVKLRRARLILELVTTFSELAIPLFSRPLRPTQPGHPSVLWLSEYWLWFQPPLRRNCEFCVAIGPVIWTTGILAEGVGFLVTDLTVYA